LPQAVGFVVAISLLGVACGSDGSETVSDTSSVPLTTETTVATTSTTTAVTSLAPASAVPTTCAEVDTFVAALSPSDRAMLSSAPILIVRHGPTGGDTWQIWSMTDVTGQMNPELTVYYDWSPATGLSDPVMIPFGQDTFADDPNAQTLLMLRCMEVNRNVLPVP
jgi:hypothetical protein